MGNFSRDTFDRLKHYVGVRLQQGVPIVDADWNEMEDIRKYELQAFLKWFVGSGVPMGSDGFHILPAAGFENDFIIERGRCLVDGLDVINEEPIKYTDQLLYQNPGWADKWEVQPLPGLTTPTAPRIDEVYLDVWEREVNAAEDSDLVNDLIGLETCVRRKREWLVRVAEGMPFPEPASGHYHYHLATLNRPAEQTAILRDHIRDRRMTGLAIPSYLDIQQMHLDAFGPGYTLDHDGEPNLKVSLREATNALLRGGLPSTPETQLTFDPAENYATSVLKHSNGDIWLFLTSNRSGDHDIWYRRYSAAAGRWSNDIVQVTTNIGADSSPFAIEDKSGKIWIFWSSHRNGSTAIWYKVYSPTAGSIREGQMTGGSRLNLNRAPSAVVGSTGDIWVFWFRDESEIWCKRYDPSIDDWADDEVQLSNRDAPAQVIGSIPAATAVVDSGGNIWVFWLGVRMGAGSSIRYRQYSSVRGDWGANDEWLSSEPFPAIHPFAIADGSGDIWVFWSSDRDYYHNLWFKLYRGGYWGPELQLTTDVSYDVEPTAMKDAQGDIWVFWCSQHDISCKKYNRVDWSPALRLTDLPGPRRRPMALEDNDRAIWLFWNDKKLDSRPSHVWCRKLFPAS